VSYDDKKQQALIALAHNVEIACDEGIGSGSNMAIDPEAGTLNIVFQVAPGEYAQCTFTLTRMLASDEPDWLRWRHPYVDDEQLALWNRRSGTIGGRR
jgi:hypothetical protein